MFRGLGNLERGPCGRRDHSQENLPARSSLGTRALHEHLQVVFIQHAALARF